MKITIEEMDIADWDNADEYTEEEFVYILTVDGKDVRHEDGSYLMSRSCVVKALVKELGFDAEFEIDDYFH